MLYTTFYWILMLFASPEYRDYIIETQPCRVYVVCHPSGPLFGPGGH